jgi:hypothetical protein
VAFQPVQCAGTITSGASFSRVLTVSPMIGSKIAPLAAHLIAPRRFRVLVLAGLQHHAAYLALRRRLARRSHTGAAASMTSARPLSASSSG